MTKNEKVIKVLRSIADLLEQERVQWVGELSAEYEAQYIDATTLEASPGQREALPVRFIADALIVRVKKGVDIPKPSV